MVDRLAISVKEAAAMLGVSKNLAYDLARRGKLPGAIRLGAKRVIISRAQFERFLEGDNGKEERDKGGL